MSSTFEADFNKLIDLLNEKLEDPLGNDFVDLLRDKARVIFDKPATVVKTVIKEKKKRAITNYGFFMQEFSKNHPGQEDLFKEVSKEWAKLSKEQKAEWKVKAQQASAEAETQTDPESGETVVTAKKKRGPNGWHLFITDAKASGASKKEANDKWKALSEDDQKVWKNKAATASAEAAAAS